MRTVLPPSKPAALEPLKWALFSALERLSDLRGNAVATSMDPLPEPTGQQALWVFVSTIGELNATGPFLRELHARLGHLKLVLITDHEHYRAPYLAQYPDATVFVTGGHSHDARRLARHHPPAMLVVAEIPCLPSDAPCRFSYAFLRTAKKHGAPVCLVNGWLYHYQPACRMDDIESRLFRRDYIRMFDAACVQNAEVRDHLIAAGAEPQRVTVTGNIKFDAMQRTDWTPSQARSPHILQDLLESRRLTVVAGCVTGHKEQQRILDAFSELRARHPRALLVLAPRHPEVHEHMVALEGFLAERGLEGSFRSRIDDTPLAESNACLVLDTIGELKDFYATATLAYVGVDHNILEPLSFEKPVTIGLGWNKTYPSYPVYHAMLESGGVMQVSPEENLSAIWLRLLDQADAISNQVAKTRLALDQAKGATQHCLASLEPWISVA
jgi:3-deoxy-D-manno-octulosonic-acid transferase